MDPEPGATSFGTRIMGWKAAVEQAKSRPNALPVLADNIPRELQERPQWVAWKYERRQEKWTKLPLDPRTGRFASSTNPATWGSFAEALAYYKTLASIAGIGYVFSSQDPFAGVDLDDARNPETGAIEARALDIIRELHSYTEISPSGTGLKIFLRGRLLSANNRRGNIEVYDWGRYFAVTGAHLAGTPLAVHDRHDQLVRFHAREIGAKARASSPHCANPSSRDLDDAEVICLASQARNGAKFQALWRGDRGTYGSHSEADLALCVLLKFWVGSNAERIDRLFRQSGLYRPKWEREDYRQRTIQIACSGPTADLGLRPKLGRGRRMVSMSFRVKLS